MSVPLCWRDILDAKQMVVSKKISFVGSCSMVGANIMIFEISLGVQRRYTYCFNNRSVVQHVTIPPCAAVVIFVTQ